MLRYIVECRERDVVAETVIMLCYIIECRERCSGTMIMLCYIIEWREGSSGRDSDYSVGTECREM